MISQTAGIFRKDEKLEEDVGALKIRLSELEVRLGATARPSGRNTTPPQSASVPNPQAEENSLDAHDQQLLQATPPLEETPQIYDAPSIVPAEAPTEALIESGPEQESALAE